jgi:hypothetical protein
MKIVQWFVLLTILSFVCQVAWLCLGSGLTKSWSKKTKKRIMRFDNFAFVIIIGISEWKFFTTLPLKHAIIMGSAAIFLLLLAWGILWYIVTGRDI